MRQDPNNCCPGRISTVFSSGFFPNAQEQSKKAKILKIARPKVTVHDLGFKNCIQTLKFQRLKKTYFDTQVINSKHSHKKKHPQNKKALKVN